MHLTIDMPWERDLSVNQPDYYQGFGLCLDCQMEPGSHYCVDCNGAFGQLRERLWGIIEKAHDTSAEPKKS